METQDRMLKGWAELIQVTGISKPELKRVIAYYGFPAGKRINQQGHRLWGYAEVSAWIKNEDDFRKTFQERQRSN